MASGKNSWCGVAGGRSKKGNRVEEDCVVEISKTTTTEGPADPFNCLTREVWAAEKVDWCCANKGLGCTTPEPPNTPPPPTVEPEPTAEPPVTNTPPWSPPVTNTPPWTPPPFPTTPAPPTTTKADEVSAEDDPHLTDLAGDKFDLYSAGSHELIVIPQGASAKDANLIVSGEVEQFGERDNDLWIRTLSIKGKWVKGGSYSFKTNNAPYGNKATVLVRRGRHNPWITVDDLDDANLIITSDLDSKAPYADFSESVSRKAEVITGPVRVQVSWATAQKDGDHVNHLDVHVKGLGGVTDSVGGLLAGEISS